MLASAADSFVKNDLLEHFGAAPQLTKGLVTNHMRFIAFIEDGKNLT